MKLITHEPLSRQDIVFTAVFGALWGLMEIGGGTLLHAAKIPFRGVILSAGAVTLMVVAKEFARYRGSVLLAGAVAATLKVMSLGGLVLMPVLAITMEALIGEVVFGLVGYRYISSIVAGGLVLLYTFSHGLLAQGIFFGLDVYRLYYYVLVEMFSFAHLDKDHVWAFVAILAGAHVAIGIVAATFGWKLARRTRLHLEEGLT